MAKDPITAALDELRAERTCLDFAIRTMENIAAGRRNRGDLARLTTNPASGRKANKKRRVSQNSRETKA